jgi:hypothetical protein
MKRAMTMNAYGQFAAEDVLEQLASPEIVLPEQLQGQGEKLGEKRLMFAVLAEAVGSFQHHARATSRRGKKLFREVEEWINSMDNSWIYSFESICHVLSLDANNLRAGLRVWKAGRPNSSAKVYQLRRVSGRRASVVAPRATATKVTLRVAKRRAS